MNKGIITLFVTAFITTAACSQKNSVANAAAGFLHSLTKEQLAKAQYAFSDGERYNWHFVPVKDRKGIMLNELSDSQQKAAFAILKYYLSDKAYQQVSAITQLEAVLNELEQRQSGDWYRDPSRYTFLFFGVPSDTSKWGWRFEGHHISFNFSSINGKLVSGTPGFMGSNPAIVLSGPQKGMEILKTETVLGFELVNSLSADQIKTAVKATEVPGEIITGNDRKAVLKEYEGISFDRLTKKQQEIFLQLLSVYVHRYTKKFADDLMAEIQMAGLKNIYFLWAGSTTRQAGKGYYYRIHGPTLLIEYDNTQNKANHIHTVVRDLKHDFGEEDALAAHYKQEH